MRLTVDDHRRPRVAARDEQRRWHVPPAPHLHTLAEDLARDRARRGAAVAGLHAHVDPDGPKRAERRLRARARLGRLPGRAEVERMGGGGSPYAQVVVAVAGAPEQLLAGRRAAHLEVERLVEQAGAHAADLERRHPSNIVRVSGPWCSSASAVIASTTRRSSSTYGSAAAPIRPRSRSNAAASSR